MKIIIEPETPEETKDRKPVTYLNVKEFALVGWGKHQNGAHYDIWNSHANREKPIPLALKLEEMKLRTLHGGW